MKEYHSVQARISGSCCLTELCLLVHNNLEKAGGGCLLEQAGQLGQVGHGDIDQVGLVVLAQVLDVLDHVLVVRNQEEFVLAHLGMVGRQDSVKDSL